MAIDYTIPTYSRPDLGFDVPKYIEDYYKAEEEKKKKAAEESSVEGGADQSTDWASQAHNKMYPGHQKLANDLGFSGLLGPKAARPGNKSYDAMIDARKTDMQDWGIDLTHTTDGKRPNGWPAGHAKSNLSGKYSSQNFKNWMDLSGGKIGMTKTTDTIPQTAAVTTDDEPVVTTSSSFPALALNMFSNTVSDPQVATATGLVDTGVTLGELAQEGYAGAGGLLDVPGDWGDYDPDYGGYISP